MDQTTSKLDELLSKIDMTPMIDNMLRLKNAFDETLLIMQELKEMLGQEYDIEFAEDDND